jgi:tetratricopeptide (TPR) repeat protein
MLVCLPAWAIGAQETVQPAQTPTNSAPSAVTNTTADSVRAPAPSERQSRPTGARDRRRAAKLFLDASKLFQKEQFDDALREYQQAAALDPENHDYPLAAEVARSHAVTALIQAAAKARLRGDPAAARAALQRAHELDPQSAAVAEHLRELTTEFAPTQQESVYEQGASDLGVAPVLSPTAKSNNFHLRSSTRQLIQTVFKAYGIDATVDSSVPTTQARLDLDDATFEQATRALGMVTTSFWVPVDAHRVLVARDTNENRQQFMRQELETVYLSGLTATEMTDIGNLAKNVFEAQHLGVDPTAGTLSIRAPASTLDAFNATLRELLDGRSQVLLEVRLIQLAHTNTRNTGTQLPQQLTAFNVYAEEQSILNSNQALVQEIISSGLAAPGDTLAILGILLSSGQVTNSIFSNGIALFGGGLTLSGLSPGPASANLSLNSSDSRELDQMQLRLGDGEEGTVRTGMRYPIMTASFSSLGGSSLNIPGLTGAGSSSSLSSLLSSFGGTAPNIPQVQYQDLGLTLKATPKVMRSGEVALTVDLKITALAGPSLNGVPVLNNRAYSAVVTLKEGAGVVVMSELSKQETRALSGTPGLSEIPGLNDISSVNAEKDYATLLIIITPRVIRGAQAAGHSPMMRIDRGRPTP